MKQWVSKVCAEGKAESEALVKKFRGVFDEQVRRYGWFDSGSLYIGGSVGRGEVLKTSDLDLLYFAPEGGIQREVGASSALTTFRAASIFNARHDRKVNIIALDYERVPKRCLPPLLGAGFLRGTARDLEALLIPGDHSERASAKLEGAIASLAAISKYDPMCAKNGFNGLRFGTVALCLAKVKGDVRRFEKIEGARQVLYAYCRTAERIVGHCGGEAGQEVLFGLSVEERDGCRDLLEAVESARETVRRSLLDLCRT